MNSSEYSATISVDLVKSAQLDLDFLKFINGKNFPPSILKKAVFRYEKIWLPLCEKILSQNESLSRYYPPNDVAWIWHCHLLSPHEYRNDLIDKYGHIFDHSCPNLVDMLEKQQRTLSLWENNTGTTFDYSLDQSVNSAYDSFKTNFFCDLYKLSQSQKIYYYQVCLPHFSSLKYLKKALKRYKQYLHLKQLNPCVCLQQCYAIDIIWRSHQLNPKAYYSDCMSMFGKLLCCHDNGPKLSVSYSNQLWIKHFKEDYICPGAAYRGQAPIELEYFYNNVFNYNDYLCRVASLSIQEISLNQLEKTNDFFINAFLGKYPILLNEKQNYKSIKDIEFNELDFRLKIMIKLKNLKSIVQEMLRIEPHINNCVQVNLLIPELSIHTIEKKFNIQFKNSNYTLFLKYVAKNLDKKINKLVFKFKEDQFKPVSMRQIEDVYNIFDIRKITALGDRALIARHLVLIGSKQDLAYKAEILHIPKIKWSSIRILFNGKCTASAHLINSNHLPLKSQVEHSVLSIDPRCDRAMLIRDLDGDFAVVKAKWTDQTKENIGHLFVTVFRLETSTKIELKICVNTNRIVELNFSGIRTKIDLTSAELVLNMAENVKNKDIQRLLCVVMSISLLHVLLQPKSKLVINNVLGRLEEKPHSHKQIDINNFFLFNLIGYRSLINMKLLYEIYCSREQNEFAKDPHEHLNNWIDFDQCCDSA